MLSLILFFAFNADCRECQATTKVRAVVTVQTEVSTRRRGAKPLACVGSTPPATQPNGGSRKHHLFGHRLRGASATCSGGSCR